MTKSLQQGRARPVPWWAGWRLIAVLIAAVTVGGTAGYILIEGWSAWDAFYMTVITITTVGYGDLAPVRPATQLLVAYEVVGGVVLIVVAFGVYIDKATKGA